MKKGRPILATALGLFAATVVTAGAALFILPEEQLARFSGRLVQLKTGAVDLAVAHGLSTCRIKGNVSINSGRRIYHVPGQEFYSRTRIRPEYGERWFCTEADARAAGWQKAGR